MILERISFEFEQLSNIGELYALVTVEAAGVIAKPGLPERELVVYNIGEWVLFTCNCLM